jgi:hypothetical protein
VTIGDEYVALCNCTVRAELGIVIQNIRLVDQVPQLLVQ